MLGLYACWALSGSLKLVTFLAAAWPTGASVPLRERAREQESAESAQLSAKLSVL